VARPKPTETLGAQQLKANFGSLRLKEAAKAMWLGLPLKSLSSKRKLSVSFTRLS
jgi:hypothetical protein